MLVLAGVSKYAGTSPNINAPTAVPPLKAYLAIFFLLNFIFYSPLIEYINGSSNAGIAL